MANPIYIYIVLYIRCINGISGRYIIKYTRGGQRSKCPEMWLFRYKSCLNDITIWSMMFGAKRTTPVVWTEIQFKFWHWVSTYRPPRPKQDLFSSQNKTGGLPLWYQIILGFIKYIWWRLIFNKTGGLPLWYQIILGFIKYIWWRLIFHLFGTPFAGFLKENGPKWGIWPTTGSFHSIFVAMIFIHQKNTIYLLMIQIGAVGGEIWRIGSEK